MPIELEEVALFGLFLRGNRTIQIREENFKEMDAIISELAPILIDYQKLYKLGFIRYPDGAVYRQQGTCDFMLRPMKDGRWEFMLNGGQRIRIVSYIHQVQRLWFDLFDEHLFMPRNYQRTKAKPNNRNKPSKLNTGE